MFLSLRFLLFVSPLFFFGQSSLSLVSGNKSYVIKEGEECHLFTVPFSNDTVKNFYTVYIGTILDFKDSVITLEVFGINTVREVNGSTILHRTAMDNVKVEVHLRQIEKIENFRRWFIVPAFMGWLSLLSAIIAAPLIAIDFKEGSFDGNKFARVGGISLGTAAVFMTTAYCFGRHSSYLNNYRKPNRRVWKVQ